MSLSRERVVIIMTIANKITILRMVMIPAFVLCMYLGGDGAAIAAFVLFMLASATDKIDGYIARRYNQVTNLGKIMDPLADKLLVFAAMVIFVERGEMHSVAFLIIIARELLITSMRAVVASGSGRVVGASFSGKLKTGVQVACILIMLLMPVLPVLGLDFATPYRVTVSNVLGWVMAAVTLWSGVDYCIKLAPAIDFK